MFGRLESGGAETILGVVYSLLPCCGTPTTHGLPFPVCPTCYHPVSHALGSHSARRPSPLCSRSQSTVPIPAVGAVARLHRRPRPGRQRDAPAVAPVRHTRGAAHQPTSSRYGFLRRASATKRHPPRRHRAAPFGRRASVSPHRKGGGRAHRAAPIFGRPQTRPPQRPQSGRRRPSRALPESSGMRVSITWRAPPKFRLRGLGGARSDAPLRVGETRAAQRVGGTQRHERRPKPTHRGGGWLAPSDRGWITSCHLRVRSVPAGQGMDRRGGPPATSGVLRRPAGAPARTCCPLQVTPDSK